MTIEFQNILPIPLVDVKIDSHSVWNTSFSIHKGESILVSAASGKGKTTFTDILAGNRKDYQGKVLFNGKECSKFDLNEWTHLRKEKLSFVYQDLQLFTNLTVGENLQIKNRLTNTFQTEELKELTEKLGIGNKWDVNCGLLSMGQQQRVAIIRALCQPFGWIILDEPFSHLDEENTQLALNLIQETAKNRGAGILITTLGNKHNFDYDQQLIL